MKRKIVFISLISILLTFAAFAGGWTLAFRTAPGGYTVTSERGGAFVTEYPPVVSDEYTPVNINTATADELITLPGIGAVRAAAIIAHREQYGRFTAPEDIMEIAGIGEGIYLQLAGLITTEQH